MGTIPKREALKAERIILGIDPGTQILGWGVIRQIDRRLEYIRMDVLRLEKISDPFLKLKKIYECCTELIDTYHPDEVSVESPFYGKNVQSLLKLGRAQGVSIAAAMSREVPVYEYAPLRIKQSITGNGRASKEQVFAMLSRILQIEEKPTYLDASDAIGAAVCHALQNRNIEDQTKNSEPKKKNSGKSSSWNSFLSQNPDRILKK